MLLNIDATLVDWSRAQFALTAIYHWLFVPLTLGLSFLLAIMESIYAKTGNPEWKRITQFWMKIFAINFAIGVATGLILEFQFGTNWSNYSWMVGDIFGAPLAIEGIMAFFIEATFFAVMFFGWERVNKRFHLFSTWMVAIGSNISALWILVANAWMNHPIGMSFNPDTARSEMNSFWEVLFSPMASSKFIHTVLSGCVYASAVVVGISCWYLLKNRELKFATKSIIIGATFGVLSSLFLAFSGDYTSQTVAKHQPMKLASMEGLYQGKEGAGFVLFGIINPSKTVDNQENPFFFKVEIPKLLSILTFRNANAFVPGITDLVNGNEKNNIEAVDSRIDKGKDAIIALQRYKMSKLEKNDSLTQASLLEFKTKFQHFGYGYLKTKTDAIPPVGLTFYSFHIMILLGGYFIVFFGLVLFLVLKNKFNAKSFIQKLGIITIPLALIATVTGWIVAEVGRQPWAIQDLLPVGKATSNIDVSNVKVTFIMFTILFTALLIAELKIMFNAIKTGPKGE
ncbi:MAG: cytochrome ubiquinol oxidase subunit I [Bacteroidota bacterium]